MAQLRPEHDSGPPLLGRAAAQVTCLTGPAIDAPHLAGRRHPRRERRAPQRSAPRGTRRPLAAAAAARRARRRRPSPTPQACRGRRRARSARCSAAWLAPWPPAWPRCERTAAARTVRHARNCACLGLVCVPSRARSTAGVQPEPGPRPAPLHGPVLPEQRGQEGVAVGVPAVACMARPAVGLPGALAGRRRRAAARCRVGQPRRPRSAPPLAAARRASAGRAGRGACGGGRMGGARVRARRQRAPVQLHQRLLGLAARPVGGAPLPARVLVVRRKQRRRHVPARGAAP